jgi:hypothetical protein
MELFRNSGTPVYTYLKMKFASVTSDAFFNVLKSAKKTAYNVLLKTFKELGKLTR